MKCPHCDGIHSNTAKFCEVTGKAIEPQFQYCKNENCDYRNPLPLSAQFCPNCGNNIRSIDAEQTINADKSTGHLLPIKSAKDLRLKIYEGGKMGFIDPFGNIVVKPIHEIAYGFDEFSCRNGYQKDCAIVGMNGKYGVINRNGDFILDKKYDRLILFGENIALLKSDENAEGIYNIETKIFVHKPVDIVGGFGCGRAPVKCEGDKYGFINTMGEIVIEPKFDDAYPFQEDFAAVKEGYYWGFIDTSGNYIVEPKFSNVHSFISGFACVEVDNCWGIINKTGVYCIAPSYKSINEYDYETGYKAVTLEDNSQMIIDRMGRNIRVIYDKIRFIGEGLIDIYHGVEHSIYDLKKNKLIFSVLANYIGRSQLGFIPMIWNGQIGILSNQGEKLSWARFRCTKGAKEINFG